jgi:hypothetical protein
MMIPVRLQPARSGPRRTTERAALLILALLLVAALAAASAASAATPSPGWTLTSIAAPTNFSTNDSTKCTAETEREEPPCDAYRVRATDAGSKPTDGSAIVLSDPLPAGLTVRRIAFFWSGAATVGLTRTTDLNRALPELGQPAPCTASTERPVRCTLAGLGAPVKPDDTLQMVIYVTVDEGTAGPLTTTASVSGGGAASVFTPEQTNQIGASPAPFGPAGFSFNIAGLDGSPDIQAGDHPYELTTTIDLNSTIKPIGLHGSDVVTGVQDPRDVVVDLPLGFAGSTLAAPQCTLSQLSSALHCPPNTVVGHITTEPLGNQEEVNSPIWNLTPEHGIAGELGYVDEVKNAHVFYVRVAPTPAGYVLRSVAPEIPGVIVTHIAVTFFGDPAERDASGNAHIPLFTNPTGCTGSELTATMHLDSWQNPGRFNADGSPDFSDPAWKSAESKSPAVTGCNALQFSPELRAQPTTTTADSPSGLEFELKLAQSEVDGTLATPALRNAAVALPEGMTVDPSAGNGLEACSEAQIGWLGGTPTNFSPAQPECPGASKIGSLELTSPLISGTLSGSVYLARQNENPFGSVLAGYIVVDDPVTGVLLKIAGEFKADPHTGRITAFFDEDPPLPFSDLKLHFFGGPRATLATPESCGTFTTTSDLAPWSAPDSGPDATPSDGFSIDGGCVSGFAPSFTAGATDLQAGAYSPFQASFSRSDSDQELGGLSVSLPPGLLGKITGVPLCPDVEASAGSCPEASRVGSVTAGAGPGPNPLFVTGSAYLTGPYNGGPYGLSVVVPAVAGPFNFGNVVVRQSLRIDPHDAHVTDVSDPFPTILDVTGPNGQTDGVPIKLRRVDVSIDRPGFTFNPTNCNPMAITATISALQGATAQVSSHFQVTNCATLKFAPKFQVSIAARSTKQNGESLTTKLSYPNAPQGTYANIAKVKVDLPIQLPSRLTTLQKACLDKVFEANPAACPPQSIIGHAIVHTPILPAPLIGPAYFVSHGGEAFPSLTMLLQGNGVTVDLVGTTFINKAGITSTTFQTVPDTPFNTFELTLPQGKFSALGANLPANAKGNFCGQKLVMPTFFKAQNGAEIHQNTPVSVTGCAKAKTRAQLYAAALKACHRKHNKGQRQACERAARKRYAPPKKAKT